MLISYQFQFPLHPKSFSKQEKHLTMGSRGSRSYQVSQHEMEALNPNLENGKVATEQTEFPHKGDPLEGLELDDKVKKLWQTCQDPDLKSILDHLDKAEGVYLLLENGENEDMLKKALEVKDRNGMNIFHALFFDPEDQDWYTKNLKPESRKKVVTFIETICQKFPESKSMMIVQDHFKRTPLHYAGIIDIDDEKDEKGDSNITLALLKNGADEGLFLEDSNKETPVSFIATSNLKAHLDTKQRNQGPVGHTDQVAHCDISILQPKVPKDQKTKYPLNLEYLKILARKHRDLFDHQVISAMIWEKRKEYLPAIGVASIMKLLALILVLVAFGTRFGPQKEQETSSNLFYASFAIEFFPWLMNIKVVMSNQKFFCFFHHSRRNFLLSILYLAIGISLIAAFEKPERIDLSYQKGLSGFYCICCAYSFFRTSRDLLQPTFFEMFGWFEVVFKNIIKLLAVSKSIINMLMLLTIYAIFRFTVGYC